MPVCEPDDDQVLRWWLDLKTFGPDANMVKRGTAWSRRLSHRNQKVPFLESNEDLQRRVQCRDTSGDGLNPDDDIHDARAVTREIDAEIQYDVFQEIQNQLRLPLRAYA